MSNKILTIDIGPLFGTNLEEKLKVADQIRESCKTTGFFAVSNHCVNVLDELNVETFKFFKNLSTSEKLDLAPFNWNINNTNTYRGYFPSVIGKEGFVNLTF